MTVRKGKRPEVFPLDALQEDLVLEGDDALRARKLLQGVELGTWVDDVLVKFPKADMIRPPHALGLNGATPKHMRKDKRFWPNYVVQWYYEDFTLTISRGISDYPVTFVYAVQKIEIDEEALANVELTEVERDAGEAGRREAVDDRPEQFG